MVNNGKEDENSVLYCIFSQTMIRHCFIAHTVL